MKPHQQSQRQVGYKPPRSTEISARQLFGCIAAIIVMLVLLNVVFPEPVPTSCAAPAQVVKR